MMAGMHARLQGVDDGEVQGLILRIALSVAVPLWIEVVRLMDQEQRAEVAEECHSLVNYGNDDRDPLRGRGNSGPERMTSGMPPKRPGDISRVFNATALGLAVMAFAPGGVNHLGIHWEARDE